MRITRKDWSRTYSWQHLGVENGLIELESGEVAHAGFIYCLFLEGEAFIEAKLEWVEIDEMLFVSQYMTVCGEIFQC